MNAKHRNTKLNLFYCIRILCLELNGINLAYLVPKPGIFCQGKPGSSGARRNSKQNKKKIFADSLFGNPSLTCKKLAQK